MTDFKVEVCCGSPGSVVAAFNGGAHRIELCDNLYEGGTTPSLGAISHALKYFPKSTMVMIRPRGGDFYYTPEEIEIMCEDIKMARNIGANGFVFGLLSKDAEIDITATKLLMNQAKNCDITFHRAFDMTKDPFKELETLIELGIPRVLTSGTENKSPQGIEMLKKLITLANNRITIMPGGGINDQTITNLVTTGAKEYHIAPTRQIASQMNWINTKARMGAPDRDEGIVNEIDSLRVQIVVNTLTNHNTV